MISKDNYEEIDDSMSDSDVGGGESRNIIWDNCLWLIPSPWFDALWAERYILFLYFVANWLILN